MKDTVYGKKALVNFESASPGGAILSITKGNMTDMLFHMDHEKLVYVVAGTIRARVLKDGTIIPTLVSAGHDFYVKRGLVHQFEALTDVLLVEFVDGATSYEEDAVVVAKFRPQPTAEEGEFAKMTPEDEAKLEEQTEAEEPPTKPTRKKRTTKKKTTKKKTTKKTSKRRRK